MLMVRSSAKLLPSRRRSEVDLGEQILVIIPRTVHASGGHIFIGSDGNVISKSCGSGSLPSHLS